MMDLTHASVFAASASPRRTKAATMLVEEVEKRTRIRWQVTYTPSRRPFIALGTTEELKGAGLLPEDHAPRLKPEGYRILADNARVLVEGADDRGVFYGVGYLLRTMSMRRDEVFLPEPLHVDTAPHCRIRGHQLGYRPKTNSYDGWTAQMWEQYLRDLIVFGANAIELIPPRSDDEPDSPMFPKPPLPMMVEMSGLANEYDLDVWIWYPAMDPDYSQPGAVEKAVREWAQVFRALPRVDAVFVPGGDPGHTDPDHLFALLEQQAASLRSIHPRAQMWVSPQGFNSKWLERFFQILHDDHPAWLSGVVYGPQVRIPLREFRKRLDARYPIRDYPDITHTRQCQYTVPDWDVAYAVTEGREPINPRPLDYARIIRATQPFTIGFIAYSEGCNDDVNKAVWSALAWDPDADVTEVLRQYSRCFIGPQAADGFAQGILALERNWKGPLIANAGVDTTLAQFQQMEQEAGPQLKLNWRFQQALYRAYYDAYVRRRLLYETHLEQAAYDRLREASRIGSLLAMQQAEETLLRSLTHPVAQDLRSRIFELAEALFQSIRMQLSVPRYHAIAEERGANLDAVDAPLNNRVWLLEQFHAIREMKREEDRQQAIAKILNWTNPGPGGFYDQPGAPERSPHLMRPGSLSEDPGSHASARVGFADAAPRIAWTSHAETLYDTPLVMKYTGLDPDATYRIRVVYAGDSPEQKIRLTSSTGVEIHPFMAKPRPIRPVEFAIPAKAIENGQLTLEWTCEPGRGRNGRGCQVSEVWLIRE
ncbi:MAG: glycoside hydrolase family 20 zincin-like fold domain-containing protein [Chthonomonadales bacterium]